jgi:hypothetical protein
MAEKLRFAAEVDLAKDKRKPRELQVCSVSLMLLDHEDHFKAIW